MPSRISYPFMRSTGMDWCSGGDSLRAGNAQTVFSITPTIGGTLRNANEQAWVICMVHLARDNSGIVAVELLQETDFHAGNSKPLVLSLEAFHAFCKQHRIFSPIAR